MRKLIEELIRSCQDAEYLSEEDKRFAEKIVEELKKIAEDLRRENEQ
jgi:intein-encoded DNA endonuclease-like protein